MQHATHKLSVSTVAAATLPTNAQLAHPADQQSPEAIQAIAAAQSEHSTLISKAQENGNVQTDSE